MVKPVLAILLVIGYITAIVPCDADSGKIDGRGVCEKNGRTYLGSSCDGSVRGFSVRCTGGTYMSGCPDGTTCRYSEKHQQIECVKAA